MLRLDARPVPRPRCTSPACGGGRIASKMRCGWGRSFHAHRRRGRPAPPLPRQRGRGRSAGVASVPIQNCSDAVVPHGPVAALHEHAAHGRCAAPASEPASHGEERRARVGGRSQSQARRVLNHAAEMVRQVFWGTWMVLPDRIELSTSPLPRECSTTELRQQKGLAGIRPEGRARTRAVLATRSPRAQARLARFSGKDAGRLRQNRAQGPGFGSKWPVWATFFGSAAEFTGRRWLSPQLPIRAGDAGWRGTYRLRRIASWLSRPPHQLCPHVRDRRRG